MNDQNLITQEKKVLESTRFDYDNTDWPRDYDIRIDVAEQREVLEHNQG